MKELLAELEKAHEIAFDNWLNRLAEEEAMMQAVDDAEEHECVKLFWLGGNSDWGEETGIDPRGWRQ